MRDAENTLLRAQTAHGAGNTTLAERLYRQIIGEHPGHPIANSNLCAILINRNREIEAEGILASVINTHPTYCDAIANMAACQGRLANWQQCLSWSNRAIQICPGNPMSYLWAARATGASSSREKSIKILEGAVNSSEIQEKDTLVTELVLTYLQEGRRSEALRAIKRHYNSLSRKDRLLREIFDLAEQSGRTRHFFRVVRAASRSPGEKTEISFWLAKYLLSRDNGMHEKEAINILLETARLNPRHSEAWQELGIILRKQNNIPKAVACLHRSIKENCNNLAAHIELINTHLEQAEVREAIRQSARMRRQFPDRVEALTAHCHALVSGDKWDAALRLLSTFRQSNPSKADRSIMNCEGVAYTRAGQYTKAAKVFKDAIRLFGHDAAIWNNRGMAYGLADRPRPEIQCYRRAIAIQPEDPGSHVNLAMARLAQGDYVRGLKEYEWRLNDKNGALNGKVNGSLVERGDTPAHLLVVTEQGLGDTLQFVRYLYDLRPLLPHATLTLACPEKLCGLLRSSLSCVDNIIACETSLSGLTEVLYLPLMSLPHFCGVHPHKSCAPTPYLQVDNARIREARKVLCGGDIAKKMIIGLNWKGNPLTERTNLKGRSMTLNDLRELADMLPEASFISLQKGFGSEELDTCSFSDRFLPNQSVVSADWCFVNTSAYILACDFIVTTDTSIAHLSGALGQETHLLLAKKPEWRWCPNDDNSRWYPSMSLYRQVVSGDWRHAVRRVAAQIQQKWSGRHVA